MIIIPMAEVSAVLDNESLKNYLISSQLMTMFLIVNYKMLNILKYNKLPNFICFFMKLCRQMDFFEFTLGHRNTGKNEHYRY